MGSWKMSRFAAVFLIFLAVAVVTNGQEPLTPDADNKCGGCPCNNPCAVPPPPPPPSPPPPPPPAPKPPKPGPNCPPPPKTPSSPSEPTYPTPPSQYVYFTGPPGSLYPIDQNFSGAARGFSTVGLPFMIGSILLAWW